mgnify:CR=1 FL=1
MTMKLTEKQSKALNAVLSAQPGQIIVLRGFAGTGKSVTSAEIMRQMKSKNLVITPTAAALSVLKQKLAKDSTNVEFKTIASLMTRHQMSLKVGDYKTFYPTIASDQNELDALNEVSDHDLQSIYDIIDEISDMIPTMNRENVEECFDLSYFEDRTKKRVKTREQFESLIETLRAVSEVDLDKFILTIDTDALEKCILDAFKINPFGKIEEESEFDYKPLSEIAEEIAKFAFVVIDEMSMMSKKQAEVYESAIALIEDAKKPVTLVSGDPGQLKPVEGSFNAWCDSVENEVDVFELKDVLRSTDEISVLGQMIRSNVPLDMLATSEDCIKVYERGTTITDLYLSNEETFKDCDVALAFTNKDVNELNTRIRQSKDLIGHVQPGDKLVVSKNVGYSYSKGIIHTNGAIYRVEEDLSDVLIEELESLRSIKTDIKLKNVLNALKRQDIKYIRAKDSENRDRLILVQSNCYALSSKDLKELSQIVNKLLRNQIDFMDSKRLKEFFKDLGESDDDRFPYLVDVRFGHAMTVHKSQGSQFKKVAYIVSSKDLWIQSQDLKDSKFKQAPIYVAVTRAEEDVTVFYIK